ncbi:unnamed protein product [Gemmata massiliana]|uniref:Uncharacterized protein n=1 Tax=Gemmata massiliana TaxID=1210884 RepID=A0A6P2D080_9BACT|nr:hypothetical protein [Gemmata massiliana]VTR92832.1 unnamed protein product [Gemmata massiliana]
MLNFHFNVVNVAGGDGRQFTALGDGKILKLLATWGPVIAGLFGLKLPPLPDLTSDVKELAVDTAKS